MSRYIVQDIRDIALLGHRAAGKTTLADALLYEAHAVDRFGSVDEGTSVSDFDEEEHKHHFSIDTSVMHADFEGKHLHLLDAPGSPDFVGAALEALEAAETAVIVVSATGGIEVNTRKMFTEAGKHGLARILVINKIDAENVDLNALLANLREAFGRQCVLFNVPDVVGPQFSRLIDLLEVPKDIPDSCPVDVVAARAELIDTLLEGDEAMLERYLLEETVSRGEVEALIPRALANHMIIPVFCTDAKHDRGVAELLHALCQYGVSPSANGQRRLKGLVIGQEGSSHPVEPNVDCEFLGQVFKSVNDKYIGHLSFVRVLAGKMRTGQPLYNLRTGKSARVSQLLSVQGKQHAAVGEAVPGEIVAVPKIEGLQIGDTVSHVAYAPRLPEPVFPTPMFGLAIEPKQRGDEQKISNALHRLVEEDPTFRVTRDSQTHELVIHGVSPLHLDIIRERLKRRFDLEVITHEPKVAYRETILSEAAADYRHKKQSGGRGQFAEVHLRIYPLSRDIHTPEQLTAEFANKERFEKLRAVHYHPEHNFAFIDHIVGGSIPNQFIPAVEKGCLELIEQGALAGYHIQDVAVEVHFGKDHPVDSSEAAFKIAGRRAFKEAFLAAGPVLLEPMVRVEVTVPSSYLGGVLSDLTGKRAHIEDQEMLPGDLITLRAVAPLGELSRYAAQLKSVTQGNGSYAMEFSHYEMVPANVQQQIVSKARPAAEDEA